MSSAVQKVFECPWWWVEARPYTDAAGAARNWYTVCRPNPETVHILGLTEDLQVPLIRQWRPGFDAWLWELPAGICDVPGEAVEAAAARELEEETGYRAERTILLLRGTVSPGLSNEMWNGFLCLGLRQVGSELGVHGEQIELHMTPFAQLEERLLSLAAAGEYVDSKIFGHIALTRRYLEQGRD
ncbi:NUDIX hydrolase [bacterium]|nr:NUDIX hydrolase [bacterium]